MADALHRGVIIDLVGEVLHRKGNVHFTVTSPSMEPAIQVGDQAEVGRVPDRGPRLGEVILYHEPVLGHIVHRVVWRWPLRGDARLVYTKGDAAAHRDAAVPRERVLGRVVRVLRGGESLDQDRSPRWRPLLRSVLGMVWHRLGVRPAPASPEDERR